MSVVAIVPAYNEEASIGPVVTALVKSGVFQQVVAVDDGSKDRTAEFAQAAGARVIRNATNLGKGGSMLRALQELPRGADVAFFDADLVGLRPHHALKMKVIFDQGYDMVCGLRDRDGFQNLLQLTMAPIITGERMIRRWLVDSIPEDCWSGYAIETAMNDTGRRLGARTCLFFMRGVTIRGKITKTGVLSGLGGYWKMFAEMKHARNALNGTQGCTCR